MKNDTLEYKGYHARIEYDSVSKSLFGKVEGIKDLVTFESDNLNKVEDEFHAAVDDYLDFCKEVGKTPDKEYLGKFNVRIDPALHRKIAEKAYSEHVSLNAAVEKAIKAYAAS